MDNNTNSIERLNLTEERKNKLMWDSLKVIGMFIFTCITITFAGKHNFGSDLEILNTFKLNILVFLVTLTINMIVKYVGKYILIAINGYNKRNVKKIIDKYIILSIIGYIFSIYFKSIILHTSVINGALTAGITTIIFTKLAIKNIKKEITD